jgi:hypothetical protein
MSLLKNQAWRVVVIALHPGFSHSACVATPTSRNVASRVMVSRPLVFAANEAAFHSSFYELVLAACRL